MNNRAKRPIYWCIAQVRNAVNAGLAEDLHVFPQGRLLEVMLYRRRCRLHAATPSGSCVLNDTNSQLNSSASSGIQIIDDENTSKPSHSFKPSGMLRQCCYWAVAMLSRLSQTNYSEDCELSWERSNDQENHPTRYPRPKCERRCSCTRSCARPTGAPS